MVFLYSSLSTEDGKGAVTCDTGLYHVGATEMRSSGREAKFFSSRTLPAKGWQDPPSPLSCRQRNLRSTSGQEKELIISS